MSSRLKRALLESAIVAAVIAASAGVGMTYLFERVAPHWYTSRSTTRSSDFITSVMIATGRGFVHPAPGNHTALDDFLEQRRPDLSPAELPADLPAFPPTPWEQRHRYLLYTVGGLWWLCGISWPAVKVMLGLMFAGLVTLVYGLLRAGMNRGISVAGAMFFMLSPGVLGEADNIRDFAKVPFILAAVLILAHLIKRPVRTWIYWLSAAGLGLIIGAGLGFRYDVYVCLPASVLVLIGCARGKLRWALVERTVAVGLLLAAFVAVSWPVYKAYQKTGAPIHDLFVGLNTDSNDNLGIERVSYEHIYDPTDAMVFAAESTYAHRILGSTEPFYFDTARAEQAGRCMLIEMFRLFPADFVTRGYAGVLWALEGARPPPGNYVPIAALTPPLNQTAMVACAAAAFLLLCAYRTRVGWISLILFLYFAAYVGLQFQYRHAFHLAVAPIWIMGFVADKALYGVWRGLHPACFREILRRLGAPRTWWTPSVRRVAFSGLAAATLLLAPLVAGRLYQVVAVDHWLHRCAHAELKPLSVAAQPIGDMTFLRVTGLPSAQSCEYRGDDWPFSEEYLVAEFAGSPERRRVWLHYESDEMEKGGRNFSGVLDIAPTRADDGGTARVFFPVYESQGTELGQGWTHFAGLIVPKDVAPAFKRMYRVEDLGGFGLLPVVTLPADLALVRRCQRVRTPDQALLDQISLFQRAVQDRLNPPQPGGSPDAIQRNRAALAQDPKNLGAAYGLGTALEARGDSPGALEAYRAAIAVAPDFRVFYRCINKLTAPPIDPEQRVRTWQDTVQQFPSAYRAHYYLGLALEAKHDLPAAAAAYRQALQLQPADYAVYGRLGMLLLQQQLASDRTSAAPDLDAAREVLRDGAMRNPDEPGALEYLDSFYVKTNDREGRVLEWDSFVAARPNLALAHYHLGVALDEDGEWTRAAEVLSRAAALDPRNSLILTRLAQTSLKNGDAKAVKRCWRALCHAGSDRVGLAVSLATAVRSLREQRQIDQAIAALLLVVSLEPRCSWAWSELGAALEEQGDRDGAARAYRIANNTAPK